MGEKSGFYILGKHQNRLSEVFKTNCFPRKYTENKSFFIASVDLWIWYRLYTDFLLIRGLGLWKITYYTWHPKNLQQSQDLDRTLTFTG